MSLNIIFVHLTKLKFEANLTLEVLCKKIKCKDLPYDVPKDAYLQDMKIESLIQLYEKVEEKIYARIESRYTGIFGAPLSKEQECAIEKFIQSSENKQLLETILRGLKGFVLRYLEESIVGDQNLNHYLTLKEGLWPMDRLKEIKIYIKENFPSVLSVENTIAVIRRITKYLQEKKKKQDATMIEIRSIGENSNDTLIEEPSPLRKKCNKDPKNSKTRGERPWRGIF